MDPAAGSLEPSKWPKKLVREAPVEIEPIWISLGLVAKLAKLEESVNFTWTQGLRRLTQRPSASRV